MVSSAHDGQIGDLVSKIEINDGVTHWRSAPPWLAYFLSIGEKVALAHESGERVAVIVAPPVRCYAAAAAAASAVVSVARAAEAVPEVEEHFCSLARLPLNTALVVKMGEKIYAAKFAGIVDRNEQLGVNIEYPDGTTHYIPKKLCQRIQVGVGGKKTLPRQSRHAVQKSFRSISAILGDAVAAEFVAIPTVDVVLVGNTTLLSQELTSVMVRAASARSDNGITLAELFRAAQFLPEGGISRSMLVSDRIAEFEMPVSDTPHAVIFDGARAFARYRARFRNSSWIAILDRCSPSLMEGAEIANEEFVTRAGEVDLLDELAVPPGTEVLAFQRR